MENAGDLAEIENNQDIAKVKAEWNCGDWLGHGEILQASALLAKGYIRKSLWTKYGADKGSTNA